MVLTEFGEKLVQCMSDEIVVMITRFEDAGEERFHVNRAAHSAEFKVVKPEVSLRETKLEPSFVQHRARAVSHRDRR